VLDFSGWIPNVTRSGLVLVLQSVRTFFRKNITTCQEWLSHMSSCVVTIAIHAGMPAVAVRHGFTALKDFTKMRSYKEVGPVTAIEV